MVVSNTSVTPHSKLGQITGMRRFFVRESSHLLIPPRIHLSEVKSDSPGGLIVSRSLDEGVKGDTDREQDMKDDQEEPVTVVTADEDGHTLANADSLYQFPSDASNVSVGSVTYRVVSLPQTNAETPTSQRTTVQTGGQPALAQVIQAPFNSEENSSGDGQGGETRFTYFPASAMSETNGASTGAENQTLQSATNAGGQFYVMMSPQDVLQGVSQRTIAPRTHQFSPKLDTVRTARDDRRRATHNEGEYSLDFLQSKGGILMKTCEYIDDLKNANGKMAESLKETERLSVELEIHRQQVEELKNENALLRAQLQQHGVEPVQSVNS
ncbi:putative upstream stimulatory factor isoform X3 [Apostichopus japonicus]|uniref:Putative upstream stimulatory factor isoform X3 n=1 Tax=Stichopus japonicus TaxID=307972 RepID=A0A2G8KL90_STIJA|nr:putative upstream stimulatory factor isoform X3 [Apostichopus japonicus]